MQNLIDRLRADFGKKTVGELLQDREAAALEIERLTRELTQLRAPHSSEHRPFPLPPPVAQRVAQQHDTSRKLIRLREVCNIVGLSRSTIYAAMSVGKFPRAIHVGVRSVRWKASDIENWLKSKEEQHL